MARQWPNKTISVIFACIFSRHSFRNFVFCGTPTLGASRANNMVQLTPLSSSTWPTSGWKWKLGCGLWRWLRLGEWSDEMVLSVSEAWRLSRCWATPTATTEKTAYHKNQLRRDGYLIINSLRQVLEEFNVVKIVFCGGIWRSAVAVDDWFRLRNNKCIRALGFI